MSSKKSTITTVQCTKWIYGPQVSPSNSKYALGGQGKWKEAYDRCLEKQKELYKDVTPKFIIDNLNNPTVLITKVIKSVKECATILDVLLIHSAFINALGVLQYEKPVGVQNLQTQLQIEYSKVYDEIEKILKDKDDIEIFVPPDEFLTLLDTSFSPTKNIVLSAASRNINVLTAFLLTTENAGDLNHPISPAIRNCLLENKRLIPDCIKPFEKIQNKNFKPVADLLGCYCSLLKQDIKYDLTNNTYSTFNVVKYMNLITHADHVVCRECFKSIQIMNQYPPIIIRKKINTYLSQLIEHIYIKVYKPKIIEAKSNAVDNILFAATENIKIGNKQIHYYHNAIKFFRTKMSHYQCTFPMYSIDTNSNGQEYFDESIKLINTDKFCENVTDELFRLGVFKPMEGESDRYELNTEFDIELLDCFRDLPNNQIKNELKQEFTDVFYRIVGSYLIFLRINQKKLNRKISRMYLIKQYNLIDFTKNPEDEDMETKLALCSIYLIEKASATFKKEVIKMMEDPEYAKGLKMNRTFKIVEEDFSIYNDDSVEFIENVIDYIYKNAYKHYMEGTDDVPLESDDFKINRNMGSFLQGLTTLKDFNTNNVMTDLINPLITKQTSVPLILNILRKIDIISV